MYYASIKREASRMQEELRVSQENSRIAEAMRGVAELQAKRAAKKAAKEAEKKAFWDAYYAQLEKTVPHEGGAKRSRRSRGRVFKFD